MLPRHADAATPPPPLPLLPPLLPPPMPLAFAMSLPRHYACLSPRQRYATRAALLLRERESCDIDAARALRHC